MRSREKRRSYERIADIGGWIAVIVMIIAFSLPLLVAILNG